MEETQETEQESSGFWAYLVHPLKVLASFPKNLKEAHQEGRKIKSLATELNNTSREEIKKLHRWSSISGFCASLTPMVVAAVSKLSIPTAIISFMATNTTSGLLNTHNQRITNISSKRIRLKKEKELANLYLNSPENKAEQYKVVAPKVGDSLEKYVNLSASTKSARVQLITNAALLMVVNPVSSLLIAGISLYNTALRLYDLKAMKKNQQNEISSKNKFHQTINNLVDAASIIRETNNSTYANGRLEKSMDESIQTVEENAKKQQILDNKKRSFFSISNAIMWGASLFAGVAAGEVGGPLAGSAIFAAALMAAGNVAQASDALIRLHSEKIEAFREYEENMKELHNSKSRTRTGERSLDTSRGHLQMKNVWFTYDSGQGVKDISLNFERGKINVITGESGSGKTTVFSLLKHDLEAQQGTVSIDDVNIQELTQESINDQISYIAQKPVFLKANIKEEMRLFGQNATEAEMTQALSSVGLGGLSLDKPTYSEDEKPALSGGQMQRLAIARALLKKSPILMMDEPTASLDPTSKQEVWDVIEKLKKDKTVVLVSHDAFEIMNSDNIALLEQGRLTAIGSPEDLKENPYLKTLQERAKQAVKEDDALDESVKEYLRMFKTEQEKGIETPDLFTLLAAKKAKQK